MIGFVRFCSKMLNKNLYMKNQTEMLFGFHCVNEALKAGKRKIYKIFIGKTRSIKRFEQIIYIAKKRKISLEYFDIKDLDIMSKMSNHQGIIAKTSFLPVKNSLSLISKSLDIFEKKQRLFFLILESIEDPHNLGALIRSAHCANVDYILISKNRTAKLNSAVSKSSAGAMEYANIYQTTNNSLLLRALKKKGMWIFGLEADSNQSLFETDLKGNIALVIGGEHKGLRTVIKKECDFLLSIPIKGEINSLNASVAGSIAIYEVIRQNHE